MNNDLSDASGSRKKGATRPAGAASSSVPSERKSGRRGATSPAAEGAAVRRSVRDDPKSIVAKLRNATYPFRDLVSDVADSNGRYVKRWDSAKGRPESSDSEG
jgi:hypothetical protein